MAGLGGFDFEYFGVNTSRIEDGRIQTFDKKDRLWNSYAFLRKAGARDVVRLCRMILRTRRDSANRFIGGPYFRGLADAAGDPDLSEYFGEYLRSVLVRPMVLRMNGAEPEESFLGTFGSNLGMFLDSFEQLTGGFEPLFKTFGAQVPVRLGTTVHGLVGEGSRIAGLRYRTSDGTEGELRTSAVVLAIPAGAAASLLEDQEPELGAELREIRYNPVAVVLAEYDGPVFDERVRALVLPKGGPLVNAGSYGVDDRHIVRYTFSGVEARALLAEGVSSDRLLAVGETELGRYIPVRRQVVDSAARVWSDGLCSYSRRHEARLARIGQLLRGRPGLHLTGDYWTGSSIEACFRTARQTVTEGWS